MPHKSYSRHRRSSRRGGSTSSAATPSSYSDSASFMMSTVGDGNTQYDNVFVSDKSSVPGNTIVGLQGQRAGGKMARRHKRSTKKRKGGYWGQILTQAAVPFTLLGMQQSYRGKRRGGTKKSRGTKKRRY